MLGFVLRRDHRISGNCNIFRCIDFLSHTLIYKSSGDHCGVLPLVLHQQKGTSLNAEDPKTPFLDG